MVFLRLYKTAQRIKPRGQEFFIFQYKAGIVNSANFTSHI